ncbi:MAG: hypothetical protein V1694_01130 [Candidatus Eisenbacteria bacterium]
MRSSVAGLVVFIPLLAYIVYIVFDRQRKLKPIVRAANKCRRGYCIHYQVDNEREWCPVNEEHFQRNAGSGPSCNDSQALISEDELKIWAAQYSKQAASRQNVIAALAILGTALISLFSGGK